MIVGVVTDGGLREIVTGKPLGKHLNTEHAANNIINLWCVSQVCNIG